MIRGDSSVEKFMTTYVFLSAFYSFAQNLSSANNALVMTNRGLSYSTISAIVSSFFVCTLILNYPTGILADRWGRSKLVVPGYFLYAAGIVCFGVSTKPWHFLGAELCQALSAASLTGALEAWIVDALGKDVWVKSSRRVIGRAYEWSRIATVMAGIAAYALMRVGETVPFFASGVCAFLLGCIGAIYLDERRATPAIARHFSAGSVARDFLANGRLIRLSVVSALLQSSVVIVSIVWQGASVRHGASVPLLGLMLALFNAGAAMGGRSVRMEPVQTRAIFVGALSLIGATAITYLFRQSMVALVTMLVSWNVLVGVTMPLAVILRNSLIADSTKRASLLSLCTNFGQGAVALCVMLGGRFVDLAGVTGSLLIAVSLGALASFFVLRSSFDELRSRGTAAAQCTEPK